MCQFHTGDVGLGLCSLFFFFFKGQVGGILTLVNLMLVVQVRLRFVLFVVG